jgi:hypothetical protein
VVGIKPAALVLLAFIFTRLVPRIAAIQSNWQRVLQALPSFEAAERLCGQFLPRRNRRGRTLQYGSRCGRRCALRTSPSGTVTNGTPRRCRR